jgi:hypothetical protein
VEAANAGYLEAVSTYIHLNPVRAGLIEAGKEKLKSYRWSSYPWYVSAPGRAPDWLERRRVLGALRLKSEERRGYEVYLEGRALEIGVKAGRTELAEKWKALRRGWYVGGEGFAARLRGQIQRVVRGRRRESHRGAAKAEHGEQAAEKLLRQGLVSLGLAAENLARPPKVSPEKAALAGWLRERTTVSLRWVGARLQMGHYTNASGGVRKMKPGGLRRFREARAKLQILDTNEVPK